MPIYHFDIGDTTDTALGMCADVEAPSKAEAVRILRDEINNHVDDLIEVVKGGTGPVRYLNVYFNAIHIMESDIDEEREE